MLSSLLLGLAAQGPCLLDIQSSALAPRVFCAIEAPKTKDGVLFDQKRIVLSLLPSDPREPLARTRAAMGTGFEFSILTQGTRVVDGKSIAVVQVSSPKEAANQAFGEVWFLSAPRQAVWCNGPQADSCGSYLARFVRSEPPQLPAKKTKTDFLEVPSPVSGIFGPPFPLSATPATVGLFVATPH